MKSDAIDPGLNPRFRLACYQRNADGVLMYAIVVPGKVGAVNIRYASAADALKKYREMESDGLKNIDVRDAIGEPVDVADLELGVKEADADQT